MLTLRDADAFVWLGNAYIQPAFTAVLFKKATLGIKARDAWLHAAQVDPKNADAREYLSSWFETAPSIMGGDRTKAVAYARVARLPDDMYALYHVGRIAGSSGQRTDDGIAALLRTMSRPLPTPFRFGPAGRQYWLGVLFEQKGKVDDAVAHLDSAVKLSPTDQQAREALARVNARRHPPVEQWNMVRLLAGAGGRQALGTPAYRARMRTVRSRSSRV